jgi:hypothetical protein
MLGERSGQSLQQQLMAIKELRVFPASGLCQSLYVNGGDRE